VPFGWVTADEAYGGNGPLRTWLEERGIACVLAIARDHLIAAAAGPRRADILAAAAAWQRVSCGDGAKGPPLVRLGDRRHRPGGDHPARPPLDGQAV
jgi:hypothetical protein